MRDEIQEAQRALSISLQEDPISILEPVIERTLARRLLADGAWPSIVPDERFIYMGVISGFFRDDHLWDLDTFLARRVRAKWESGDRHLRTVHLGTAFGEEPYSVALLVYQALEQLHADLGGETALGPLDDWIRQHWRIDIDAHERLLGAALIGSRGLFSAPQWHRAQHREPLIQRVFQTEGDAYRAPELIRSWVHPHWTDVARDDELTDALSGQADLWMCCNVVMHLRDADIQRRVVSALFAALEATPGSRLLYGDTYAPLARVDHDSRLPIYIARWLEAGETNVRSWLTSAIVEYQMSQIGAVLRMLYVIEAPASWRLYLAALDPDAIHPLLKDYRAWLLERWNLFDRPSQRLASHSA